MRGRLMGIVEDYGDDIERLNTHQGLIPSQECEDNVSAEDVSVLAKSGAIVEVLYIAQNSFPNSTNLICQVGLS